MTDTQFLIVIAIIYLSHETNSTFRFAVGTTAIFLASLKGLGIL